MDIPTTKDMAVEQQKKTTDDVNTPATYAEFSAESRAEELYHSEKEDYQDLEERIGE